MAWPFNRQERELALAAWQPAVVHRDGCIEWRALGAPLTAPVVSTEVAAMAGISAKTVRREIDRGHLQALRPGKSIRIDVIEFCRWLGRDAA
jgi:excisionase family DNA binding protein